jgi:hypothetical protein
MAVKVERKEEEAGKASYKHLLPLQPSSFPLWPWARQVSLYLGFPLVSFLLYSKITE